MTPATGHPGATANGTVTSPALVASAGGADPSVFATVTAKTQNQLRLSFAELGSGSSSYTFILPVNFVASTDNANQALQRIFAYLQVNGGSKGVIGVQSDSSDEATKEESRAESE